MDENKKTFNFTILFFIVYAILAILVLLWIWWPNDAKKINGTFNYQNIDGKQKAIDIYTIEIRSLLTENDLELLYNKLDEGYKKQYGIDKNNYKVCLEQSDYISKDINIVNSTVNIQENIDLHILVIIKKDM